MEKGRSPGLPRWLLNYELNTQGRVGVMGAYTAGWAKERYSWGWGRKGK